MLEIRVYDREEEEFKNIPIDLEMIEEFGISNKKLWNRNGTFKKFQKEAYVYIKGMGRRLTSYNIDIIKELKEALKCKYTTSKSNDYEYKNYNERKCTNWRYEIIKNEEIVLK